MDPSERQEALGGAELSSENAAAERLLAAVDLAREGKQVTLDEFQERLWAHAERMIDDIRADQEANGITDQLDYSFEVYSTEVSGHWTGSNVIGVVYAGDLGRWWFVPSGDTFEMVVVVTDKEEAELLPRIFGRRGIYGH